MRTLSLVPSMLIVLFTVLTGCAALQAGDAPDSSSTGQLHPPAPKPAIPAVMRNAFSWEVSQDTGNLGNIERLKALNPNVVHTWPSPPGIRGCRPPVLLREWVKKRWQAQLDELHAAGIRVWASTDSTGFSAKVFEECGLDPEQYYARDENGERVLMLGGGYGELYSSCYNNPEWFALQKEIAMTFADAGFEGLWLDVGGLYDDAVFYCHCEHCRAAWRKHMIEMGRDPETPQPLPENGEDMSVAINRVHAVWRLKLWEENWGAVRAYVQTKHPDYCLIHNFGYGPQNQCDFEVYMGALTDVYGVTHMEEFGHGLAPYCMLPSYLIGRGVAGPDRPVVMVENDVPARNELQHRIALAEACAAGGADQNVKSFDAVNRRYFDFLEENEAWYTGDESAANVAVVLSWWSKLLYEGRKQGLAPVYWFSQMLVDLHVPHDVLILERDVTPERLLSYKAVILPDLACLSDDQIGMITQYVHEGGRVVTTYNAGRYNEEKAPRSPSGVEVIAGQAVSGSSPILLEVGEGRLVHFPEYPERDYWNQNPRDFSKQNTLPYPTPPPAQVTAALDWILGDIVPLRTNAAQTTGVILKRRADSLLIHMVNYNVYPAGGELTPDLNIAIDVNVPDGRVVEKISLISPDWTGAHELDDWTQTGSSVLLTVDRLDVYVLAVVDFAASPTSLDTGLG